MKFLVLNGPNLNLLGKREPGVYGTGTYAGAYTHYSYAIYDALLAVRVPAVEVHISDISRREAFRRTSVTAPACRGQIVGHGFRGYLEAMELLENIHKGDMK